MIEYDGNNFISVTEIIQKIDHRDSWLFLEQMDNVNDCYIYLDGLVKFCRIKKDDLDDTKKLIFKNYTVDHFATAFLPFSLGLEETIVNAKGFFRFGGDSNSTTQPFKTISFFQTSPYCRLNNKIIESNDYFLIPSLSDLLGNLNLTNFVDEIEEPEFVNLTHGNDMFEEFSLCITDRYMIESYFLYDAYLSLVNQLNPKLINENTTDQNNKDCDTETQDIVTNMIDFIKSKRKKEYTPIIEAILIDMKQKSHCFDVNDPYNDFLTYLKTSKTISMIHEITPDRILLTDASDRSLKGFRQSLYKFYSSFKFIYKLN